MSKEAGETKLGKEYTEDYDYYSPEWRVNYGWAWWIVSLILVSALGVGFIAWIVFSYLSVSFVANRSLAKFALVYIPVVAWIGVSFIVFFVIYLWAVHFSTVKKQKNHKERTLFERTSNRQKALMCAALVTVFVLLAGYLFQGSVFISKWNASYPIEDSYTHRLYNLATLQAHPFTDFPTEVAVRAQFDDSICGNATVETIGASTFVNTNHLFIAYDMVGLIAVFTFFMCLILPEVIQPAIKNGDEQPLISQSQTNGGLGHDAKSSGVFRLTMLNGKYVHWSLIMFRVSLFIFLIYLAFWWAVDAISFSGWWSSGQPGTSMFWDVPWTTFIIRLTVAIIIALFLTIGVIGMLITETGEAHVSALNRTHFFFLVIMIGGYIIAMAVLHLGWLWSKEGIDFNDGTPIQLTCRIQPDFRDYNAFRVLFQSLTTILLFPVLFGLSSAFSGEVAMRVDKAHVGNTKKKSKNG